MGSEIRDWLIVGATLVNKVLAAKVRSMARDQIELRMINALLPSSSDGLQRKTKEAVHRLAKRYNS
jgi:hypothetical protein